MMPQQSRVAVVAVALAVVAILAGGLWSLTSAPHATVALRSGELALEGGTARVDHVASAARPQHAMPGMGTDNDPVAAGDRRVSVDITLRATGEEPVEFDVDDFSLVIYGSEARRPHRAVLPESVLPPGTQLSGTLVFDVPKTATRARLSYDGQAPADLSIPPEISSDNIPAPSTSTHSTHSARS
jgi:hypothetical protein